MVGGSSSQRKHVRLAIAALATLAVSLVGVGIGLDTSATATVGASSFNAEDQTLDVSSASRTVVAVADEPSGSSDNSYAGGGPKEDDLCPSVDLDHAAPPKADLVTFWHGSDTAAPGVLYLAWARKSTTGTLTVDFELNQDTSRCANGVNPTRTPGDLLVTYDFQGGTSISIEVRKWTGSAWGSTGALSAVHYDRSISANESFGELAIDLIGADILDDSPNAPCIELASGWAKTRTGSTSAFATSTIKDFILPVDTSISNCGVLTVEKEARPASDYPFVFTATGTDLENFTLDDDDGEDDTYPDHRVFLAHAGQKTVSEGYAEGWDLDSITCTGPGSDKVNVDEPGLAVDLAIGDDITCRFVNTKPGTITIIKDAQPDNGRDFSFSWSRPSLQSESEEELIAVIVDSTFVLDDDDDGGADATHASSKTFTDAYGWYSFTEADAVGWTLTDIDCGEDEEPQVELVAASVAEVPQVDDDHTVSFFVGEGESVACTFVNVKIPPQLTVTKTANPTQVAEPGAPVVFTVSVTNDSPLPVTITDLSDSVFEDVTKSGAANSLVTSTTCVTGTVLAAADAESSADTYSCTFTAHVSGNGGALHENIVTATGVDTDDVVVRATDNAKVGLTDVLPRIDVTKSADKANIHAGDDVTYTYVVTNPGVEPLSVAMADDKCGPLVFKSGDTTNSTRLDPGEVWTYTCAPAPALTATTTNVVTATGTDDEGNVVQDTATATVTVLSPVIAVDKSASADSVSPGTTVVYTYRVTNPGDVALASVGVSDDKCSPVTFAGGDTDNDGRLQTSETWTFVCSQVQTGALDLTTNVGTAVGTDPLGRVVSATDTVTITVVAPAVIQRAPATLPATGFDVGGWPVAGVSLVVVGVGLIAVARRRRVVDPE